METLFIARVRKIVKGKSIDGVAQTVNIIVIDLTNGKPSIVRNFAQFLQDLKNSFLIDENINNINHPQVTRVLRGLKRGTVSGEINFSKAGDKYTVTENSRVVTDPSHPNFGKHKAGDILVAEEDRTLVEGFLDLDPNEQYQMVQATADATAQAKLAMAGAFEDFGTKEPVTAESLDLPQDVMDEIVGSTKGKTDDAKKK